MSKERGSILHRRNNILAALVDTDFLIKLLFEQLGLAYGRDNREVFFKNYPITKEFRKVLLGNQFAIKESGDNVIHRIIDMENPKEDENYWVLDENCPYIKAYCRVQMDKELPYTPTVYTPPKSHFSNKRMFQAIAYFDNEAHAIIKEVAFAKDKYIISFEYIGFEGIKTLEDIFMDLVGAKKKDDLVSVLDPNPNDNLLYLPKRFHDELKNLWKDQVEQYINEVKGLLK